MSHKKTVLSCIQPTAELHIGNYFGAIENWVDLQESNKYDCIYGIVDLHAMTMPYVPKELLSNTENIVIDLLASGIDTEKSILFVQSLVPEHTELCWIFNCVSSYGELNRMTQFKEKSEQLGGETRPEIAKKQQSDIDNPKPSSKNHSRPGGGKFISTGLFTYPVLQAADILIYRAHYVPVGKDQEQHLELSRSIARRFNNQFGCNYFSEPQTLFTETPKIMSPADPVNKMSKSLGERHFIGLFESEETIRSKIKTAVTDTGPENLPEGIWMSEGVSNLFEILKACGKKKEATELEELYRAKKLRYFDLKEAVATALIELIKPLRAKRQEIKRGRPNLRKELLEMSEAARRIAKVTLQEVREIVGLP